MWRAEEHLERIKELAGKGMKEHQIAAALGINRTTLFRHKKKSEAVRQAIEEGRAETFEKVTNVLFNAAEAGDTRSAMFLMKGMFDWRDYGQPSGQTRTTAEPVKVVNSVRKEDEDGQN